MSRSSASILTANVTHRQRIELVVVGHVTIDHIAGERRLGGAAAYAALTGRHLNVRVALVTSAGPDFPFWDKLQGISPTKVPAARSTELDTVYQGATRRQWVRSLAAPLRAEHLAGLALADDAAVIYCPVVNEIEAPLHRLAPEGLCAVAPQGFFRTWDDSGEITRCAWEGAERGLARADVVCLSENDADVPEELAERFTGKAFVITKGAEGCRLFSGPDVYDFPALPAREVDPTGAGDVFAAALVIALRQGHALHEAVKLATHEAAAAVESPGTESLE